MLKFSTRGQYALLVMTDLAEHNSEKQPASEYTVGEILRAMEGDLSCISVTENNTVKTLGNETFWKDFDKTINDYVNSVTLDQIAKKNAEGSNFNYCI